jgi:hypothetical protein
MFVVLFSALWSAWCSVVDLFQHVVVHVVEVLFSRDSFHTNCCTECSLDRWESTGFMDRRRERWGSYS